MRQFVHEFGPFVHFLFPAENLCYNENNRSMDCTDEGTAGIGAGDCGAAESCLEVGDEEVRDFQ